MKEHIVKQFSSGTHNLMDNEVIPADAASDSLNWSTKDGVIALSYGRFLLGNLGAAGQVKNQGVGYKTNGTKVIYRKKGTVIQYLNVATWTDIITGLSEADDYVFTPYTSLAGSFMFALGRGGIFKMHNANPGSYIDMYDATKNFKAKGIVDKARMIIWDMVNDPTGLRGSYIDGQNSAVYTTVSNEVVATGDGVTTVFSGTLAFKGANPKANCFGLSLNMNPSGITALDNFNGVISGTGVTGTINYITGAWTLTFAVAPTNTHQVRISYQWENSNNKGVTDFTYSATRLAGEGFIIRQDEGGDAIQNVILGLDGSYYSIKQNSIYRLTLDSTDTKPYNEVYRKDLGIPYWQAATATGRGIIFINTANPDKPKLTVLEKNPLGDNIIPTELVTHFAFENFQYDQAVFETWQEYIVISCRTPESIYNNRLLLVNITTNTVDIYGYRAKCLKKDGGSLYAGDTITENTYSLFNGFDDDGQVIENQWTSRGEKHGTEDLKKYRRNRFKGKIQSGQVVGVYLETDDGSFNKVGTIRGDAETIDNTTVGTVGSSMVGSTMVGGMTSDDPNAVTVYGFFFELKVRTGKFRKRRLRFIAEKYGYVQISFLSDWDIMTFEGRIPKRFRRKQNVSVDGINTDQSA